MKIGVLIKEPGKTPRHVNISDTLENLQKTVGGHIEAYKIASDCLVICDEEGRLKGKPWAATSLARISSARSLYAVWRARNSPICRSTGRI